MEQMTQPVKEIQLIPATRSTAETKAMQRPGGKLRVAAYCRVSTDNKEQINSYIAQKTYYTQKIEENPEWEMAGIFADEGISSTSLKKRTEFKRMIAACRRRRIDLILTKSLYRYCGLP